MFVQDWQLECCGDPFAVGDRVEWTLQFLTQETNTTPAEFFITGRPECAAAAHAGDCTPGFVATLDHALSVWMPVEEPPDVALRGFLMEEHHGGVPNDLTPVLGVVRRIRLVTQRYKNLGGKTWAPASSIAEYRELTASPDSFHRGLERHPTQVDIGLLIDLEVALETAPEF